MREQIIGSYIAKKRRERGLTQEALGQRLGVTGKAVSKWERGLGFPDLDTVHAMASVLLCRVENILHGRDDAKLSSEFGSRDVSVPSVEGTGADAEILSLTDLDYDVEPLLFGANLEHTRSAVCGGLSAQLLRNRKFAGMPGSNRGAALEWFAIGEGSFLMVGSDQVDPRAVDEAARMDPYTLHSPLGYHMHRRYARNAQLVQSIHGCMAGIGQHAVALEAGKAYEFRAVLRTDRATAITVALTSHGGTEVYASAEVPVEGNSFTTYVLTLIPTQTDVDADLRVSFADSARVVLGALSLLPEDNFHGMRRDVVTLLREMKVTMLRWPGGNFAGEYNWLDGLLPQDQRSPLESHIALLTQPHTLGYDNSEINTDDFIALCREVGAEPSITVNQTWNTPEENAAWVEYCNGDASTTYGRMRVERGHVEPYGVRYWSLGNEAGYDHMEGDNTPDGYRRIAEENARAMLKADPGLILCSSGYYPSADWANASGNKLAELAPLAALHNYVSLPTYADPSRKKEEMERCMGGVEINRTKIHEMREQLSPKVHIAFDEWNCWYSWYRPQDVFSGIFAARMFHMFISEQKKSDVVISALYQPVGEGAIEILSDRSYLTPMGEAFALLATHAGGRVRYVSDAAVVTSRVGILNVTMINDSYDTPRTLVLEAEGGAEGTLLSADDIGPHTAFAKRAVAMESVDGRLGVELPPLSVLHFTMEEKK